MPPRESAQSEAEKTFEAFIDWSKRISFWAILFLGIVVVGCNSGVETGDRKSGSQYNGDQYSPMNMNTKK